MISTVAVSPGIPLGYCVDEAVGQVDLKVPDHEAFMLAKLIPDWFPVGGWLSAGVLPTPARAKEIRGMTATKWTRRLAVMPGRAVLSGRFGRNVQPW